MSLVCQRLVAGASAAALLLVCGGRSIADDISFREYQTKAERICSFARFIAWPAKRFTSHDAPFVIGVYGTDQISDLLREAIQGRRIKDRDVVIRHIMAKEELPSCHILFISRSERDRLPDVLKYVRRENVLTVGECDNFLEHGGIINFVILEGVIRFEFSQRAARRERLAVSSKLLQLAHRPGEPPLNVPGSTPSQSAM